MKADKFIKEKCIITFKIILAFTYIILYSLVHINLVVNVNKYNKKISTPWKVAVNHYIEQFLNTNLFT